MSVKVNDDRCRGRGVLVKRWRVSDDHPIPVEVECAGLGHPFLDSDGEVMHDNTHFESEAAAWDAGIDSIDASVALSLADIKRAWDATQAAHAAHSANIDRKREFVRAHDLACRRLASKSEVPSPSTEGLE